MNKKIINFIAILIMQLVLTLPFYTAGAYGLTITNVRAANIGSNSAAIEWNTDNISDGRVRYGKTTALGFTQRHDNFISNHTVVVFNGIESETNYFFIIESTDLAGNTAIDNNSNSFYTFKTTDITPPPQVTGTRVLSTTSSSVFLSWNSLTISDFSYYIIYRNRVAVGNATSNSFNDTNLAPAADYSYKVSAVDNSGNQGPQSDTLITSTPGIDSTAPSISNVDLMPITDTTAKVAWLTNENSTTTVLFGINKTDKIKSITDLVANHSIVIDGLQKNIKYVFVVKSCDASNNCANSQNQTFTAGKDITIPFINLSIPRYFNRRAIDIIGTTEPFSSVTLFVNDMNTPKRSLSNNEVGSSGKFIFSQMQLEQDNIIKVAMVDKSGNKNQKTFEVSIDTESPIVQLSDVPSLTSKSEVIISGTVNEPVTISVFVDSNVKEVSVPSKIENLSAPKIGQNSVELQWAESKDKDFSHYVVYREDASPIALTKPANFNLFIDALVDSGKSYTYQVSAVNIFANEGPKSEPVTVTTLKGGQILNLKPPQVDVFEDFRKPVLTKNATNNFNFSIRLNKGDGTYLLKLIFTDRADNNAIFEKTINLDSKKPEVKIISPPSGALIFENVANEIDVIGKTKPNARVHLFVDRTPFSFFNQSFEISGLPNEIQNLPEAQLDAKCRSNIVATSFCRTGADFSVDADSQGNFKFERVDLTAIFGGAARLSEVPPTEFRNLQLNPEAQESKRTTLVVIATDQTGQRGFATQSVSIGTCWSGNQSWDVIPLTQYQSPTLLSPERFSEGTETIYFYFNYSYIGRGTEAKITSISLSKACGTKEVLDPRFNISCQVIPSGNSPTKLNKEGTLSYSAVTLSRFPGMEQFLADDWKSFFKAISNELTFPFKVRITYEHNIIDENGQSQRVKETQTACDQVSYVVDKSIIDPRKVLPDWLLFDAVDFLQDSIKTITQLQEQINTLINYVAIGCLTSFFANFAVKIFRIWAEFADETLFKLGKAYLQFNLGADDKNAGCKEIAEEIQKSYGSLKLKYFSDADLKRCFPNSAAWWGREANIYTFQRAACDRIFGHSAPSAWTETENDDELHIAITSAKTCASDFSAIGQKIRAENCKDIEGKFTEMFNKPGRHEPFDKKCFQIQTNRERPLEYYVYALDDYQDPALTTNKIYKLTRYETRPTAEIIYAVKIDDNWYMTKQQKTCAEICGGSITQTKSKMVIDGKEVDVYEEKPKSIGEPIKLLEKEKKPTETPARISYCTTANQCREWHAKSDPNAGGILLPNGKLLKGYTVETKGYASDCFYEKGKSVEVVSDTNPNLREECCCINGRESQFRDVYYQPGDVDARLPAQLQKPVHESKSDPLSGPKPQPPKDEKGYSDMKWSYRYWKIGYLDKKYNPNRYIDGKDFTACFGQDNWFYKILGKEKEILVLNPFKEDTSTLQCIYLTGVNQRLQLIRNIMQAMSTCLIQVRTSGRADTGVCKEVFTQQVCGLFWQGIRWFIDGCTPSYLGINEPDREDDIADFIRKGFRGITQGVSEAQKEITEEYSNAKLNDLLGTGEESVARKVCLFAFGYDWEINAKSLVDAAYSAPYATLVQAVTRSREFLTVDPVSLKPKYEYRASWVINPGCDLERYDIKLVCITRKELDEYPNQISCGSVGAPSIAYTGGLGTSTAYNQCDCLYSNQGEQTADFFSDNRIKQNSLVDKNYHKVIESDRRYDHLKFILRTDRKIPANIKSNCFPTGYDKGVFYFPIIDKTARDIVDCTAQPESGLFTCSGGIEFFNRKGIAELLEVKINGENANNVKELSLGSPLDVLLKVRKTGQNKCTRASINDPISPRTGIISENGTSEIPLTVTNSLTISGRGRDVSTPENKMSVSLLEQNNNDVVNIRVEFISNDPAFSLNDPNDLVYVENINENDQPVTTEQFRQLLDQKSKGEFTVSKGGAKIKIEGVTLNPPQLQGQPYRLAGVIMINPQKQLSEVQGSQQKILTIELFHTKDDNPDECSLSEPILKREYRFVVTSQAVKTLGPNIQEPKVKVGDKATNVIKQGDIVAIVAVINDRYQLKEVDAELTAPDRTKTTLQKEVQGDTYTFVFDARNAASGDYNGVIRAKSKNENLPESKGEFKFRVQ